MREDDRPLIERVRSGPNDDVAKIFLMARMRVNEVSEEVSRLLQVYMQCAHGVHVLYTQCTLGVHAMYTSTVQGEKNTKAKKGQYQPMIGKNRVSAAKIKGIDLLGVVSIGIVVVLHHQVAPFINLPLPMLEAFLKKYDDEETNAEMNIREK